LRFPDPQTNPAKEISMQTISQRRGPALRKTLLAAVALGALCSPALAKDLPATADGAQKLSALFASYLAKPAAGAPSPVTVTQDGAHYTVAFDLASLTAPLKDSGFSLDAATLQYALTEQDDGTWRVSGDSLPPLAGHLKENTIVYNFAGYKFEGIFDPALATFKTADQSLQKLDAQIHGPKLDETVTSGVARVTQTGAPAANGTISVAAHEEIADLSLNATATPDAKADAKPVTFSFKAPTIAADINLDGAPLRKALDLWAFAAAHPGRAELAANEQQFKTLLHALVPAEFKLGEKFEVKQMSVTVPQGVFGVAGVKFGLAASSAPGPKGAFEYHVAMDGLTMPAGLLPPTFTDLVPTAFNIDVKASGFDFGAGAEEAINDIHLAGDGPVVSEADHAQIMAKMKGAAPIVIEVAPSHVVAPQVDVTLEGQVRIEGARPSGTVKVHVRNFDKTVAAIKALGPVASPQVLGGLALAKTLAKTDSDGALTWVAEYGVDGSIKVNGLPLGKAP
jgi:hypothetical protein